MQGKVFVFWANAVIFATLATLGFLLSLQLEATSQDCEDPAVATCQRSLVTADSTRTTSGILALTSIGLGTTAYVLQRREPPEAQDGR